MVRLFLIERFNLFGDYEDAIHSNHRTLWNSLLSTLINSGLLTPKKYQINLDIFINPIILELIPIKALLDKLLAGVNLSY